MCVPLNNHQLVKRHFPSVSDLQMLETYFSSYIKKTCNRERAALFVLWDVCVGLSVYYPG